MERYGKPYGEYCPVARAVETIADRWTPLIIRELLGGVHRFNDFDRGLPGISRPLLAERLRRLEHAGIVEHRAAPDARTAGYYLTAAGQELRVVIDSLGRWGAKWVFGDPRPDELDPGWLLWSMRRRVSLNRLPPGRIVVRFDFLGMKRPRPHWLVFEKPEISLCLTDPGFETDLYVRGELAAFYRVWLGRLPWSEAVRDGVIEIDGPPSLVRAFPGWLQWSKFATAVREATLHPPAQARAAGAGTGRP